MAGCRINLGIISTESKVEQRLGVGYGVSGLKYRAFYLQRSSSFGGTRYGDPIDVKPSPPSQPLAMLINYRVYNSPPQSGIQMRISEFPENGHDDVFMVSSAFRLRFEPSSQVMGLCSWHIIIGSYQLLY